MLKQMLSRFGLWGVLLTGMVLALSLVPAVATQTQELAGDWHGTLDTGSGTLRVVVHITQGQDGKLSGTLESPDQGTAVIPISAITYKAPDLHLEVESIGGSYDGKTNSARSEIAGDWKQSGQSLPLAFKRTIK
ncbi:MAG TPA: hypothetical protein VJX67_01770 [Blastocatellia bacterium]|nr:hypothetical protein [Blastocatellia bacterium]